MSPKQTKRSRVNNPLTKKEEEAAMPSTSKKNDSLSADNSARNQAADAAPAPTFTTRTSSSLMYERVETQAKALPVDALRAVDTDVYVVVSGTLLRLPKLMELRPLFVLHNFPLEPLDNLGDYGSVASDAYVAHQPQAHDAPESALLLETSVPILKRFKGEGGFLVLRGRAKAEEFETLSERKGLRNNSEGITRYGRVMLRELPYLIECKSTITEQEIEEGMALARRMSGVVGEREIPGAVKEKSHVPDDMMTRTFTLFDIAMDSVRAGLNYIFQDSPEKVEEYLPRKVKKPSTAKAKKTVPVEPKTDEKKAEADAKAQTEKPATPSANGNIPAPTPSANGNIPAPVPTANGNIPAPKREEDKAAE